MKIIYVHTDPVNAAKTTAIAENLKGEGDRIEKGGAEAAPLLKKDKENNLIGEFAAVVNSALPKAQEIVAGYKKQGVLATMVGAESPAAIEAARKAAEVAKTDPDPKPE